jgi:hypothetical protein
MTNPRSGGTNAKSGNAVAALKAGLKPSDGERDGKFILINASQIVPRLRAALGERAC